MPHYAAGVLGLPIDAREKTYRVARANGANRNAWCLRSPHPPGCARHPVSRYGRGVQAAYLKAPLAQCGSWDPAHRAGWVRVGDEVFFSVTTTGRA